MGASGRWKKTESWLFKDSHSRIIQYCMRHACFLICSDSVTKKVYTLKSCRCICFFSTINGILQISRLISLLPFNDTMSCLDFTVGQFFVSFWVISTVIALESNENREFPRYHMFLLMCAFH